MSKSLSFTEIATVYNDEDRARELLEKLRWHGSPVCPHCTAEIAYKITPKEGSKTRKGLWKCGHCRRQFTVTVGTIFEGTRIPLGKWLMAIHLLCSAKKGISTLQLMRHLWPEDGTKMSHYKTAFFMTHRIRYALTQEPFFSKLKGVVESDETYIGGKAKNMHKSAQKRFVSGGRGSIDKAAVLTLVERQGKVKTHHVEHVTSSNLRKALSECVAPTASVMTDDSRIYKGPKLRFADHQTVNHSKDEYVRGMVHVNTAESVHALLKRGVIGTYHHWSKKHLHRYLAEFDFRWNHRTVSDAERTFEAIQKVGGKRLRYKDPTRKK